MQKIYYQFTKYGKFGDVSASIAGIGFITKNGQYIFYNETKKDDDTAVIEWLRPCIIELINKSYQMKTYKTYELTKTTTEI